MPFAFVIPVYNEEDQVGPLVQKLLPFFKQHAGSELVIADNGSSDGTWPKVEELSRRHPGLVSGIRLQEKGQGLAFRTAMEALSKRGFSNDLWIVFSAADLPFGFGDVDWILQKKLNSDLVIGSKAHPSSRSPRGSARGLMSGVYRAIRFVLLGMKTRDPQGSLIFKSKWLKLHTLCTANDFFFSTQFVYFVEREGGEVVEVPIAMEPDFRPSRVKPLRDGWRVFKQILKFARREGRLKGRARHSLLEA
jgi:glycosyltransferase involved in cell wall biosynthesis